MRLNQIYYRIRAPQKENEVPFREVYPLKLKNSVSGMTKKNKGDKCMLEMMLLFACWQKTDYDNYKCRELVKNLQICNDNIVQNLKNEKIMKKKEIPIPGSKNFTDKQVNYLLHQYPTV